MSVSRSSRGVTSMENHGIEIPARSVKPPADPGFLQGADDALDAEQHDDDDHPREVDQAALQVAVEAAQVEHDGLVRLQPVAELLRVVEPARLDNLHR